MTRSLMRAPRLVGVCLLFISMALSVFFAQQRELPWRDGWWDQMQRIWPRDRGDPAKAPAIAVTIDEESMLRTQRWPWPRDLLAELVDRVAAAGAKAIVFDIYLDDLDSQSPAAIAQRFRQRGESALADQLAESADSDEILATSIYNARQHLGIETILPVPGVPSYPGVDPAVECEFEKPIVQVDPISATKAFGTGFASADPPLPIYQLAGATLAGISYASTEDFVIRQIKALQPMCGSLFPLLGAQAIRAAHQGFYVVAKQRWDGWRIYLEDPSIPDAVSFPTESDGTFWMRFGDQGIGAADRRDRELARYVSAHKVLEETIDPEQLQDRIVFIAVVDLGRIDERRSPLGDVIFGIEAHIQFVENVIDQTFLRRPWFMSWIETLLLLLAGGAIIGVMPDARPVRATAALVGVGVATVLTSGLAFRLGLLVDLITPLIGMAVVSVGVLAATLFERDRQRLLDRIALQSERADRAFLQGELDAAARIQRALLPAERFLLQGRVDLACHIDPARTVGGDFYDHVLVDDQTLFFMVADVSGKGADASQFMLLSKTLWKSSAIRNTAPLERIQLEANAEITRENAATMFVTGICGLLDLETGVLSYSSAGHDQPYLFGSAGTPRQVATFSGPPAGLLDGIEYPVGHVELNRGDRLCLFSDGVTEAMNGDGEMFGTVRLEAVLAQIGAEDDSPAIVARVVQAVADFTDGAEQSDDLTLMIISIPA